MREKRRVGGSDKVRKVDIYKKMSRGLVNLCLLTQLMQVELRPSHGELTLSVYIAKGQLLGPGEREP